MAGRGPLVSKAEWSTPGLSPRAVLATLTLTVAVAGLLSSCSSGSGSKTAASGSREAACNATSVADKALPSVVTITASSAAGAVSTGSGEIIREDGSILTNNHVVAPAATGGALSVLLSDGRSFTATITGRDPQTDLAVVKIDAGKPLPAIPIGSAKDARIGEPVVALGAPLGLSNTVTTGIVSALERTVQVPSDTGAATLLGALQTDAAINPGNSGGALTDCSGSLIGVPSAIATVTTSTGQTSTGSVGIGFAIPVELAVTVADELIATGKVTHSFFGISVQESPGTNGQPSGLYVNSVVAGGPAATAGLQQGDVITTIDGQPADGLQLALLTIKKKPGDQVDAVYERAGKKAETQITLGTPP